jgi:uncharacterized protein YaaW (UPF0174 family)
MRPNMTCGQKVLFGIAYGIIRCLSFLSGPLIKHLKKRGIITFIFVMNTQ